MNEALLKALHILTRDGKMNADSARKLKQVHHLAQLIAPFLKNYDLKISQSATPTSASSQPSWHLADLGAGKSYLGFILYDLVLRDLPAGHILAIEARSELVESSRKLAVETKFDRMKFINARIGDEVVRNTEDQTQLPASLPEKIDVITALHACDTATDDAILFGLNHRAEIFALVPCCQAEVARQLEPLAKTAAPADRALFEFPIHRREFGSHLTNVVRVLFLKSQGYRVTVTELVGWEHSMKNELILAEKISDPSHPQSQKAKAELDQLLERFKIRPQLLNTTTRS